MINWFYRFVKIKMSNNETSSRSDSANVNKVVGAFVSSVNLLEESIMDELRRDYVAAKEKASQKPSEAGFKRSVFGSLNRNKIFPRSNVTAASSEIKKINKQGKVPLENLVGLTLEHVGKIAEQDVPSVDLALKNLPRVISDLNADNYQLSRWRTIGLEGKNGNKRLYFSLDDRSRSVVNGLNLFELKIGNELSSKWESLPGRGNESLDLGIFSLERTAMTTPDTGTKQDYITRGLNKLKVNYGLSGDVEKAASFLHKYVERENLDSFFKVYSEALHYLNEGDSNKALLSNAFSSLPEVIQWTFDRDRNDILRWIDIGLHVDSTEGKENYFSLKGFGRQVYEGLIMSTRDTLVDELPPMLPRRAFVKTDPYTTKVPSGDEVSSAEEPSSDVIDASEVPPPFDEEDFFSRYGSEEVSEPSSRHTADEITSYAQRGSAVPPEEILTIPAADEKVDSVQKLEVFGESEEREVPSLFDEDAFFDERPTIAEDDPSDSTRLSQGINLPIEEPYKDDVVLSGRYAASLDEKLDFEELGTEAALKITEFFYNDEVVEAPPPTTLQSLDIILSSLNDKLTNKLSQAAKYFRSRFTAKGRKEVLFDDYLSALSEIVNKAANCEDSLHLESSKKAVADIVIDNHPKDRGFFLSKYEDSLGAFNNVSTENERVTTLAASLEGITYVVSKGLRDGQDKKSISSALVRWIDYASLKFDQKEWGVFDIRCSPDSKGHETIIGIYQNINRGVPFTPTKSSPDETYSLDTPVEIVLEPIVVDSSMEEPFEKPVVDDSLVDGEIIPDEVIVDESVLPSFEAEPVESPSIQHIYSPIPSMRRKSKGIILGEYLAFAWEKIKSTERNGKPSEEPLKEPAVSPTPVLATEGPVSEPIYESSQSTGYNPIPSLSARRGPGIGEYVGSFFESMRSIRLNGKGSQSPEVSEDLPPPIPETLYDDGESNLTEDLSSPSEMVYRPIPSLKRKSGNSFLKFLKK